MSVERFRGKGEIAHISNGTWEIQHEGIGKVGIACESADSIDITKDSISIKKPQGCKLLVDGQRDWREEMQ